MHSLKFIRRISIILLVWTGVFLMMSFGYEDRTAKNIEIVNWDEGGISSPTLKKVEKDAARVSLRWLAKGKDFSKLNPKLPSEIMNDIFPGLLSIYRSELGKAKLVTKSYKIHTINNPAVDRFMVRYKNTEKWALPLKMGHKETNSEEITALCEKFGLVIDVHDMWNEEINFFYLKANRPLNLAAVAPLFENIQGIVGSDLLISDNNGNDIVATEIEGGWQLDFLLKFDNCFERCEKQYIWSFKVTEITSTGAKVEFLNEGGDEIPKWMKKD